MSTKLRSKPTLEATKALLERGLLVSKKPPNQHRVFLCAYMMLAAPHMVFAEMGEIEEVLQNAARLLLMDFHDWLEAYRTERYVHVIFDGLLWYRFPKRCQSK